MGRSPCCSKVGLRRGPWSTKEDSLLTNFIQENGEGQWRSLPKKAGLLRCGKSCRLRWMNYLRPGIKRGNISQDEEDLIIRLHGLLGNRWSLIAGRLPGRTDNEIKNYWNTHLLKKLNSAGIHPKPHKDLPKPPKVKKSTSPSPAAATKKKKKQQKKVENRGDIKTKVSTAPEINGNRHNEDTTTTNNNNKDNSNNNNNLPKTKVYLPKPIRVSSAFSRTNSVDSFLSGSSSCDGAEAAEKDGGRQAEVSYVPVVWPLFELEDVNNYGVCGEEDDFLGGYCVLPLPESDSSNDVIMLDQVYDEYLQLL